MTTKEKANKFKNSLKDEKSSIENVINDFGGWESEEAKLRHNLTLTPEEILTWLEEVNHFNQGIKKKNNVLR